MEASVAFFEVPTSKELPKKELKVLQRPKFFEEQKKKLYERQARAMARMESIEKGEVLFREEEISEAHLVGVGWALEARASLERPLCGGVLADVMGGGKTVTTIALIANGVEAARSSVDLSRGRTGATLVMVPGHLHAQWAEEIKNFTGDALKVVVIRDTKALTEVTVKEMVSADVVITKFELLNDTQGSKGKVYLENLERHAGRRVFPRNTMDSGERKIALPRYAGNKEPDR